MIEGCPKGRDSYSEDACADCRWRTTWFDRVLGGELSDCDVKDEGELVEDENEKKRPGPDYYRSLDPEPIDVIKGWKLDFCLGNVVKYVARAGKKPGESRDKDLHKAMSYLRMELEDEE